MMFLKRIKSFLYKKRRYRLCKMNSFGWGIDDEWENWWVCCSCYKHIRPASNLDPWFCRNDVCPICGDVGNFNWVSLRKVKDSWYEIRRWGRKKKAINCKQFKRACKYVWGRGN